MPTLVVDNSVGWHLETDSFHKHLRLIQKISAHASFFFERYFDLISEYVLQRRLLGGSLIGSIHERDKKPSYRRPSCFETCDLLGDGRIKKILSSLGRPETGGGVEGVRATAIAAH